MSNKLFLRGENLGLVLSVLFLFAFVNSIQAQFTYIQDNSIPVSGVEENLLDNPWTGGVNATQINTMDLDDDRQEDLVLFDRMANKVMTFISRDGRYVYAPEYEAIFPLGISNWILLKDFNCDGLKDIFTGDILGMKVFQNVSAPGEQMKWRQFMFYFAGGKSEVVVTTGFAQKINLQLQYDDLPSLFDADQDGDLDIYKVAYTGNGSVEYHKNFSVERYGTCDSLDFVRQTQAWGDFTQCQCDYFVYNGEDCFTGGRVKHAGGKALLAIDVDDDKDNELIYSEASCNNLFLMFNEGDNANPVITSAALFPHNPVNINTFPAAFYEDVDFDGIKDLIATPNIFRKEALDMDLKASTWLYKNTGSSALPQFTFVKNNFLQDQMIDVGDNAVPSFYDEDSDGDLDMFIGYNSDASSFGSIAFYRNIGTATDPHFQFVTDDYSGIKVLKLYNIKPQIVDMSGDARGDLVFSGTDDGGKTALYYVVNTKVTGMQFDVDTKIALEINITSQENYHITEINYDGKPDLLIGRFSGALEYWQNIGTTSAPQFYLQNPTYLNIDNSITRRGMACFAADLNADQKDDLIITDAIGKLSVVSNFHEAADYSTAKSDLLFNPLLDGYESVTLGKTWPTAAKLFDSKRPAIIAGTIRGGLGIFRNEEKELHFDELSLGVYPNPVSGERIVFVETNMPLSLQVYSSLGQEIGETIQLSTNVNTIQLPPLAIGLYILKFSSEDRSVYRRIIFK